MGELAQQYRAETKTIIDKFQKEHPDVASCAVYGTTEFLGSSNACVCSRMGHTEAANIMRDGLMDEYLKTGSDDLASHLKYIFETRNKQGGGVPLISLIVKNGMECPGTSNNILATMGTMTIPWLIE